MQSLPPGAINLCQELPSDFYHFANISATLLLQLLALQSMPSSKEGDSVGGGPTNGIRWQEPPGTAGDRYRLVLDAALSQDTGATGHHCWDEVDPLAGGDVLHIMKQV
jgi:hypothetical protein